MTPHEMMGARLLGNDPAEEEMSMILERQRVQLMEMYRQATAQQCLVALIVKSMALELHEEKAVPIKTLAKRAKEAADALCTEMFGEE